MLEKRESIASVTSSSFSALLDVLSNSDKSGRLLTKQSFVVEVMVLPYWLEEVEFTALACLHKTR